MDFLDKIAHIGQDKNIFLQFQNCVVRDPSHTFILGCLTTHDFRVTSTSKLLTILWTWKFWEKRQFLTQVDLWPRHDNIYSHSGFHDSLHSSCSVLKFRWGCSTYPGDQLTPISPTGISLIRNLFKKFSAKTLKRIHKIK